MLHVGHQYIEKGKNTSTLTLTGLDCWCIQESREEQEIDRRGVVLMVVVLMINKYLNALLYLIQVLILAVFQ